MEIGINEAEMMAMNAYLGGLSSSIASSWMSYPFEDEEFTLEEGDVCVLHIVDDESGEEGYVLSIYEDGDFPLVPYGMRIDGVFEVPPYKFLSKK